MRIGGFGGGDGLANYLAVEKISAVIDATHPFAAARVAAETCHRPFLTTGRQQLGEFAE